MPVCSDLVLYNESCNALSNNSQTVNITFCNEKAVKVVLALTAFDTLDRDNAPSLARPNSVKGEYMDNAPSGSANHNMLESLPPSPPSHPGRRTSPQRRLRRRGNRKAVLI